MTTIGRALRSIKLWFRKQLLRLSAEEWVGPGRAKDFPTLLNEFASNAALLRDFTGQHVDAIYRAHNHSAAPCSAGGSAIGLSTTDAYGKILSR